jgi:thymidine phosphorylase
MVANLGGPSDFLERPASHLARAPVIRDVPAPAAGTISAIDTRAVGYAVVRLGGGRRSPEQSVDHAVGFDRLLPRGAGVTRGQPLARVHAASEERAAEAAEALQRAFTIGAGPVEAPPLVERIG